MSSRPTAPRGWRRRWPPCRGERRRRRRRTPDAFGYELSLPDDAGRGTAVMGEQEAADDALSPLLDRLRSAGTPRSDRVATLPSPPSWRPGCAAAGAAPGSLTPQAGRGGVVRLPEVPRLEEGTVTAPTPARSSASAGSRTCPTPATSCTRRRSSPRRRCRRRWTCAPVPAGSTTRGSSAAAPPTRSPARSSSTCMKQRLRPDFMPSRLFIYYNERVMEGTVDTDSGAMIRDGIKSVAKQGVCPESELAVRHHDVHRQAAADQCYTDGLKHKAMQLPARDRGCSTRSRAAWPHGFPFVFGFTVYESFESQEVAQTGDRADAAGRRAGARRPRRPRRRLRRREQRFIVRNSWGTAGGWAATSRCPTPT